MLPSNRVNKVFTHNLFTAIRLKKYTNTTENKLCRAINIQKKECQCNNKDEGIKIRYSLKLTFSITNVHSLSSNSSAWGSWEGNVKRHVLVQKTTLQPLHKNYKWFKYHVYNQSSATLTSKTLKPHTTWLTTNLLYQHSLSIHPLTWFDWPISLLIRVSNVLH